VNLIDRVAAQVPTLVLARRNLSRAGARTTLAVAAVVIGVVAIGAIGVGGEAFKQDQLEAYEGFGGTATVSPVFDPADSDFGRTFSDRDVARMRQATRGSTVLPVVEPGAAGVQTSSGKFLLLVNVMGVEDPGEFYAAGSGEIPDNFRRSVVVGSRVADENDIEVGDSLTVFVAGEFERSFRVAAVLEPQGFADPLNADQAVFVPTAEFEDPEYGQVILRTDDPSVSIEEESSRVEREFNVRGTNVDAAPVQQQRELAEDAFEQINQFLIGIGAISLLVAAVTIANTMLMSAIEREGEIGVMRAVGYPKFAVVRLLVAEATILGAVGAAVGVPFALGIGAVINEVLLGQPLAFTGPGLRYVGVGVVFGVVTSLVAGVYPAWKAANKRPVEALD
jgi:putative ABC transport system permease protein